MIIGSVSKNRQPMKVLGGLTYFNAYVPIFLALVIAALAFYGLPISLAIYRDQGILRRLSTTRVPPAWVLAAQLVLNASFAVAELILLLVVAIAGFGIAAPKSVGGLVVACSLSIGGVFAIGLWVSAIARPRTAGILAAVCFFPLMFFAGLFFPRAEMREHCSTSAISPRSGRRCRPSRARCWTGSPRSRPCSCCRVRTDLQRAGGALLLMGMTAGGGEAESLDGKGGRGHRRRLGDRRGRQPGAWRGAVRARVVVADIKKGNDAKRVRAAIADSGGRATASRLLFKVEQDIRALVGGTTASAYGRLDYRLDKRRHSDRR